MLATPSPDYEGPALHRSHCESSARWQEVPYLVDGLLILMTMSTRTARGPESMARPFSRESSQPSTGSGIEPRILKGIAGCSSNRRSVS